MSFRISIRALGIGCCCAVAPGALAAGYLQGIGPAPLRFHAPAQMANNKLPPLPPPDPSPAVTTPPSAINPDAGNTMTRAGGEPTSSAPLTTAEGAPVTAEMLVELFRSRWGEGRGRDERVIVPFGFVAPTSTATSSSSATYEKK
jgi:hypothetical protein